MLPEIVEAVQGTGVEVYMDGGVRRGTDVLKALALGARAVFIGRPVLWGLAYKVPQKSSDLNWVTNFISRHNRSPPYSLLRRLHRKTILFGIFFSFK